MSDEKFEEKTGKRVKSKIEKCSSCGANMVFNPDTQKLYCPHCGVEKEFVDDSKAEELELSQSFENGKVWDKGEVITFRCSNCGAEIVLSNGESASACPFCGTSHVEKLEEFKGLKPNGLLPFSFGEEKALEIAKQWAKRKFFAPKKFKNNLNSNNVSGIYTPCFTFDSFTKSVYAGRIGNTHTRTVGSGKNRHTETYVVWRDISGTFYENFDDILITAGTKFDQKKLNRISPFDTNSSKVYEEKYLYGFKAYKYDHEITDCWKNAKKIIDKLLKQKILSQYTYDTVDYLNVSTTHENVSYKYVMLPVYVGNFSYNKKLYNFYENGNTGKISGKTPKSPLKIGLFSLGIMALIVLVAIIFSKIR